MSGNSDLSSSNEWELSKENVQPLKHGRKVASLTAALRPSTSDYQSRIYLEKQAFEAEIRTYEGKDPLDIWYRYIQWTTEHFPKGGKDTSTLLERCIELFKDEERYRNDERYLKIWLRYADLCGEPLEIFNYMHSQSICSGLSQFYESWAFVLESIGNNKKADEVFSLGINRNAQPLERLQQLHRSFQFRLAESIASGAHVVPEMFDAREQRNALGRLKTKKGNVGVKRSGQATLGTRSGIGTSVQKPNARWSGFAVFQDDAPVGPKSSLPPSTGEWQAPPTVPTITRENTQKPGTWNTVKVPQSHYGHATPAQKQNFDVHVDEDEPSTQALRTPQHTMMDKVLSARKPEKHHSVMESLRKADNLEEKKFKVMYCKDKIYAGTDEFSFEELRAARIFARLRETGKSKQEVTSQEETKQTNFRVMYPKNEVYSFYGEFQLEEICLKRYYAYKEKKRQAEAIAVETVKMDASSKTPYSQIQCQYFQSHPEQSVNHLTHPGSPMDVPPAAEVRSEVLQSDNLPMDTAEVVVTASDELMEIASCRKMNNQENGHSQLPNVEMAFDRNIPAKKSLSFGGTKIDRNCQDSLRGDRAAESHNVMHVNSSLFKVGSSSAFKPVAATQIQPLSPATGFKIFDDSSSFSTATTTALTTGEAQQTSTTSGFKVFDENRSSTSADKSELTKITAQVQEQTAASSFRACDENSSFTSARASGPVVVSTGNFHPQSSTNGTTLNNSTRTALSSLRSASSVLSQKSSGPNTPGVLKDLSSRPTGSRENAQFNRFCIQTPDGKSELNSSHFTGPSPTVNTKIAQQEILAMFNNPLEAERDAHWSGLDVADKAFEAAFSNENDTSQAGNGERLQAFAIFDDTNHTKDEVKKEENQENRPPANYQQGPKHQPLGILQPSVDIPTGPPEEVEISDEEDEPMEPEKENEVIRTGGPVMQESNLPDRLKELSMAEYTQEHTFASTSFSSAARMSSTPFHAAAALGELPAVPWSTVRHKPGEDLINEPVKQEYIPVVPAFPVEAPLSQSMSSFSCTPSQVLSPIMERSDEDVKSTASTSGHCSTASSGRSSSGSALNETQNTVIAAANLSVVPEQQSQLENNDGQLAPEFSILIPGDGSHEITFHEDGSTDVNPFLDEVTCRLLRIVHPPLASYDSYFRTENDLPRIGVNMAVNLGKELYRVEKHVGAGAFAKVYSAKPLAVDLDVDDNDDCNNLALKVQKCSAAWELYACTQLHERMTALGCSKDLHLTIMQPQHVYHYSNGSVLVSGYHGMGTLLDIVNKYKVDNRKMEEGVIVYYTINILRILEASHRCGIIHGDVKPDNFLVIENEDGDKSVDEIEAVLKLIDFGRAVDLQLFPDGTTFTANCYTDSFQCIEMKTGRPWTYQVDTFGLAGTVFCMIYGEYMKVHQQGDRWKINKAIKRSFDTNLWSYFFDSLLNIPSCREQPSLTEMRERFEHYYCSNLKTFRQKMDRHDIFMFET